MRDQTRSSHRPALVRPSRAGLCACLVLALGTAAPGSAGGPVGGPSFRWTSHLPAATLQALPTTLTWRQIFNAPGSQVFGPLHAASESFGDLLLVVDQGNKKEGLGLTRFPAVLPATLNFQQVPQSGVTPRTFAASIGSRTIVAVTEEGSERLGRDLAFVPAGSIPSLAWQALPFSGLPAGTRVSQARVSSGGTTIGSLVLIDYEGAGKKGLALAFVPGATLTSLNFVLQPSNFYGTTFRRATVPAGTVFSSLGEGFGKAATGLDFFAGTAPASLNFQQVQNFGSITNVVVFQASLSTGRLLFAFRDSAERRGEDLVVVP